MVNNFLEKGLEQLNIPTTDDKITKLNKYLDDLLLFNPSLKLVGALNADDIVIRHILDSASTYSILLSRLQKGMSTADIGTGAGLPGIVLSILFPEVSFSLIDRMSRRIGFLRGEKALLGLNNVNIVEKDTKDISSHYSSLFSRAFHPLKDSIADLVRLGDTLYLYKGKRENVNKELREIRDMGYTGEDDIIELDVPFLNEERCLLVLNDWSKK